MPSRRMRSISQLWADPRGGSRRHNKLASMANPEVEVRPATAKDLAALNDIYNQRVAETHYTFDVEPMTIDARREWFTHYGTNGRHRLMVAVSEGRVIGYATTGPFRPKGPYETWGEARVYLAPTSAA